MSTNTEENSAQEIASAAIGMTLTPELLAMILQQNSDNTLAAIREMKKPSEDEQAKIDADKARSMALTMRRVDAAKRQEEKRETAWQNCSHQQPNGKTRFRGQGLSNGFAQAFCPECHYLSEPFQLAQHELMGGLNLSEWNGDVFRAIQQRVKNSPPPQPIPDIPAGGRIIF